MTEAGADLVVAHMGLTTSGNIGAQTAKTLEQCLPEVQAILDVCKSLRSECLVLCHGGPIALPEDAQYMLDRCPGLTASTAPVPWNGCLARLPSPNRCGISWA